MRGLKSQQPDKHDTAIPALAFCRKGQQMVVHLKRKADYSTTIAWETGKRTAKGRTSEEWSWVLHHDCLVGTHFLWACTRESQEKHPACNQTWENLERSRSWNQGKWMGFLESRQSDRSRVRACSFMCERRLITLLPSGQIAEEARGLNPPQIYTPIPSERKWRGGQGMEDCQTFALHVTNAPWMTWKQFTMSRVLDQTTMRTCVSSTLLCKVHSMHQHSTYYKMIQDNENTIESVQYKEDKTNRTKRQESTYR